MKTYSHHPLKGKVVWISGAGRGIGASAAKAFAEQGANVVIQYLNDQESANQVAAHCLGLGVDAIAYRADVRDPEQVRTLFQHVLYEFGKVDVVVNNSLTNFEFNPETRKRFDQMPWLDFEQQLTAAMVALYNTTQAVLPHFKNKGQGSIINVVSNLTDRPVVPYHDYVAAKSAVIGLSKTLASELGSYGIRVNCVSPGLVDPTASSAATKEDVKDQLKSLTPLKRIATPNDITGPLLFLASDWSQFMTGQVLTVDGGFVMSSGV
jgi:3-oxoacyl-[acyl-carrier protein] reductase